MDSLHINKFIYNNNNKKLLITKSFLHYTFITLYLLLIACTITFLCIFGIKGKLTSPSIVYTCLSIVAIIMFIAYEIIELLKIKRILKKIKEVGSYVREVNPAEEYNKKKFSVFTLTSFCVFAIFLTLLIVSIVQFANNTSNIEKLNIVLILTTFLTLSISTMLSAIIYDKVYAQQYNMQSKEK